MIRDCIKGGHLERGGDSLATALQVDEVVNSLLTFRHTALGQVQLPDLSAHLHKTQYRMVQASGLSGRELTADTPPPGSSPGPAAGPLRSPTQNKVQGSGR